MNNLSFSELCCLFCCPPCPGKIASKLAFLPPDPTYTLMCDESGSRWTLHLSERADWQYSSREKDAIECFMTRTCKGNRIACMFVRCSPNAKYTLLFSHGNAVDLGQMSSFYIGLGSRINCNIFSYDYSGYGASSGKPTEKNLYADIDAAWVALRTSQKRVKGEHVMGTALQTPWSVGSRGRSCSRHQRSPTPEQGDVWREAVTPWETCGERNAHWSSLPLKDCTPWKSDPPCSSLRGTVACGTDSHQRSSWRMASCEGDAMVSWGETPHPEQREKRDVMN
ncbi:alpha/beta hydrolase domain-containing protein 17B isoform X3 [Pyrgilauda ruficollis]|uniref:alpha/beta hydrolase domain-containing protein 17B isoform X3 n=1 Tax=Pyrgilauda ruficollis TaxID=221976 RepID=UPI001B85D745|nr:alpha/beta hydrolase domain-containing protein 17B isoform X3 [Pyrgilauda ruficollis]